MLQKQPLGVTVSSHLTFKRESISGKMRQQTLMLRLVSEPLNRPPDNNRFQSVSLDLALPSTCRLGGEELQEVTGAVVTVGSASVNMFTPSSLSPGWLWQEFSSISTSSQLANVTATRGHSRLLHQRAAVPRRLCHSTIPERSGTAG